jgi:hypothetical protein
MTFCRAKTTCSRSDLLTRNPPSSSTKNRRDTLRVQPMPGLVQQPVVEIGGEDLKRARVRRFVGRLRERHGDGVRLLARGTPEHPDAQRLVGSLLQEFWKDSLLEHVERVGVAKEARHADEDVRVEGVELLGVATQEPFVVLWRVLFAQHHAPEDASLDRAGLVEREIDTRMVAQQQQHLLEAVGDLRPGLRRPDTDGRMPGDAREFLRDARGREDEVDTPGGRGASRHRVVLGRIILRERDTALGLDGFQTHGAVGRRAGQNHPDRPLALVFRQ